MPNRTSRGSQFGYEDFAAFCALRRASSGRPVTHMVRGHDHVDERYEMYPAYAAHPVLTTVALSRRLERESFGPLRARARRSRAGCRARCRRCIACTCPARWCASSTRMTDPAPPTACGRPTRGESRHERRRHPLPELRHDAATRRRVRGVPRGGRALLLHEPRAGRWLDGAGVPRVRRPLRRRAGAVSARSARAPEPPESRRTRPLPPREPERAPIEVWTGPVHTPESGEVVEMGRAVSNLTRASALNRRSPPKPSGSLPRHPGVSAERSCCS